MLKFPLRNRNIEAIIVEITMKSYHSGLRKLIFIVGLLVCLMPVVEAQVTLNPRVESQYSNEIKITRVELKGNFTVFSMKYKLNSRKGTGEDDYERPQLPFPFPPLGGRSSNDFFVSFEPKSYLIAAGSGKKFRFVKAEGVPLSPEQMTVYPGEEVFFKVYFERLERGIEKFDLYEGKNGGKTVFWNFYGIRIKNPAPNQVNELPPPVIAKKDPEPPIVKKNPEPEQPPQKPVISSVLVSGLVMDAKTKKPIDAKIVYQLSPGQKKVDSTKANDGAYRMKLSAGAAYRYTATAKGYADLQEGIDLNSPEDDQMNRDIYLTPLAVGEKVTLTNIYFETSKAILLSESFPSLDNLVKMMQENANMEIRLEGHTDNIGDADKNMGLSIDRVMSVKRYLMNKGIAPQRIQTKGFGNTRPVTDNSTEEARQKNRRVEFVILKA